MMASGLSTAVRNFVKRKRLSVQSKFSNDAVEKVPENWGKTPEMLDEGMTFYAKLLGSQIVGQINEDICDSTVSQSAVKAIVHQVRQDYVLFLGIHVIARSHLTRRLPKIMIRVKPSGIYFFDLRQNAVHLDLSIKRVKFCSADKTYQKVFSVIFRSADEYTFELHAFLCAKKKMAQAITLTVASAFTITLERQQECLSESQNEGEILKPCDLFVSDSCQSTHENAFEKQSNFEPIPSLEPSRRNSSPRDGANYMSNGSQPSHVTHSHVHVRSNGSNNPDVAPILLPPPKSNRRSSRKGELYGEDNKKSTTEEMSSGQMITDLSFESLDFKTMSEYFDPDKNWCDFKRQKSIEDLLDL